MVTKMSTSLYLQYLYITIITVLTLAAPSENFSSAKQGPICQHNAVIKKFICVGPQTSWANAVRICTKMKANDSILSVDSQEINVVTLELQAHGILSFWAEGKRNSVYHPIMHQLPSGSCYGNILTNCGSIFKNTSNFHNIWLHNEPSLNKERNCLVFIMEYYPDGIPVLRAKLGDCSTSDHHYVCITSYNISNFQDECEWNYETKSCHKLKTSKTPKLDLREENHHILLDVYNPESLWKLDGEMANSNEIRNPFCILEDNPTKHVSVYQYNTKKLKHFGQDQVVRDLEYSIKKTTFIVSSASEGYLRCYAYMTGTLEQIHSQQHVYRYAANVFSVQLKYHFTTCIPEKCDPTYNRRYMETLATDLKLYIRNSTLDNIRVKALYMVGRTENTITFILRVILNIEKSETFLISFLKQKLEEYMENINNNGLVNIEHIRSTEFCQREKHHSLHWPQTAIGQLAMPLEQCVVNSGFPVMRKCTGDFVVGAYWHDENNQNNSPTKCVPTSIRSQQLYQLSNSRMKHNNVTKILKTLASLLQHDVEVSAQGISDTNLTIAEIRYVADILTNIKECKLGTSDISILANITDTLLKDHLINSKSYMWKNEAGNSSNMILDALDHLLINADLSKTADLNSGPMMSVMPTYATFAVDIQQSCDGANFRGLAMLKKSGFFQEQDIIPLSCNHSLEWLLNSNITTAVLLPPQLSQTSHTASRNCSAETALKEEKLQNRSRLVISFFWNDMLFSAGQGEYKTSSHIVSVSLNGVRHYDLDPPLLLLFEKPSNMESSEFTECVFWDFQANGGYGNWSNMGCAVAKHLIGNDSSMYLCVCNHFTHFGHILHPSSTQINEVLDLITIIGCSLSLLGLCGIAATALIIPYWSKGPNKKIQLQLSLALALLMSAFLIRTYVSQPSKVVCLTIGVLLHFSVMCVFCWMLVAAWFQYLRLIQPLASLHRSPHILLKTSLFAWVCPCIPFGILLISNPDPYSPATNCFPSGLSHYLSVVLPITIIVSLNSSVFVLILLSIYKICCFREHAITSQMRHHHASKHIALRKLGTLIFLFFLLGLSWIFGVLNMPYLFCTIATLQGASFFIFFVLLDKNTRFKCEELLSRRKKKKNHNFKHSSSSGMVTTRWSVDHKRSGRNAETTISILQ